MFGPSMDDFDLFTLKERKAFYESQLKTATERGAIALRQYLAKLDRKIQEFLQGHHAKK